MELTPLEFEILEFINQTGKIEKQKIVSHFSEKTQAIDQRLRDLAKRDHPNGSSYIHEETKTKAVSWGLDTVPTGFFIITNKGKKALENYQSQQKSEQSKRKHDLFLRWFPIAISFIALLKSYSADLTWLWQQLKLLLK